MTARGVDLESLRYLAEGVDEQLRAAIVETQDLLSIIEVEDNVDDEPAVREIARLLRGTLFTLGSLRGELGVEAPKPPSPRPVDELARARAKRAAAAASPEVAP